MKNIFAEIITIGDEILYGQITDTNSQWISAELDKIGIRTIRKTAVGDSETEIIKSLEDAKKRADIILVTGGLGPTNDDITKKTLSKYYHSELKLNETALEAVTVFFKSKGKDLTELNRQQAFLPSAATYVPNRSGTAPCMLFDEKENILVSMPGVPFEMKTIMQEEILPMLKKRFTTDIIYHKVVKTVGLGESFLADKIKSWEDGLPSHIKLAYLPSYSEVKLRLTGTGTDLEKIKNEVDGEVKKLNNIIPENIFGFDDDLFEKVIGDMLQQRKLTISTAESCTGGYIAYMLTTIPGSSEYFWGSTVAYQNEVKINILGVSEETLEQHGAVSEQTVREMAEGVRKKFKTDIGVSSSGIAGPTGGTEEKPVGTVWIAYADNNGTSAKKLMLGNNRDVNVKLTTIAVFNLIRQSLLKKN